ncbi:hypothetical protein [Actinoallomurus acaciae]|uniref:Uncharacterized protein n=1 Tax=Actinoallomurus acaciae TaxID=502577 RepID=A0ABV5YWR1_9ACTN
MRAAIRVTGGVMAAGLAVAAFSSPASAQTDGTVSAQAVKTYSGKFEHYDGCIEMLGTHWYLIQDGRYKIGGNGGLYGPKGFIAYPGWKIKAKGTAYRAKGSTFCTTYPPSYYFKKATVWHP